MDSDVKVETFMLIFLDIFFAFNVNCKQCVGVNVGTTGTVHLRYSHIVLLSVNAISSP